MGPISESELIDLEKKGLIIRTLSNSFRPTWVLTPLGEVYADKLDREAADNREPITEEDELALEEFVRSLDDWDLT